MTFPANDEARINTIKSVFAQGQIPAPKEIERVLRDVGLSRTQAKNFMAEGYLALSQRDVETDLLAALKSIIF
ncbi:hypothetical protein ArsFIN_22500 [Arsenophonus nasoniae]|uniref:Uncharacterized protein n=1 Tax=Arsenophonus nasoniae TaxID=638 RepID=A0A4P7L483_9GAMM|nr:hypothetical protein ArsFIN_22500 [Arsenophonus nasoniae]